MVKKKKKKKERKALCYIGINVLINEIKRIKNSVKFLDLLTGDY